jgi:hypothetical protein
MNTEILDPAQEPAYKDRSAGLVIFGILTALMGCVAGLLVPLMFFAQSMAAKTQGAAPSPANLNFAAAMYGGIAIALIWLGMGSIMKRRWARALLLVSSWFWLIIGIIGIAGTAVVLPKIMANLPTQPTAPGQQQLPPGAMAAGMTVGFIFMGIILVVIPGIWVLFYGSKHVKATVEARDPVPSWTDACPLPVLVVSLWLLFSAPMMAAMPFMYHGMVPFFGIFLAQPISTAFSLGIAVLWIYAAWSLYGLHRSAWWLIVIAMTVFTVSWNVTVLLHGPMELYRQMGYTGDQLAQMQKIMPMFLGKRYAELMLCTMVPFYAYMIFIRRYLPRTAQSAV